MEFLYTIAECWARDFGKRPLHFTADHDFDPKAYLNKKILVNELNQVPQLVKSTDPSTIVSVTQIEGAIMDWECERLRNFIKRQFKSRYRDILSPTSSRVMHPRAERGELRLCITLHGFLANAKILLYRVLLYYCRFGTLDPFFSNF